MKLTIDEDRLKFSLGLTALCAGYFIFFPFLLPVVFAEMYWLTGSSGEKKTIRIDRSTLIYPIVQEARLKEKQDRINILLQWACYGTADYKCMAREELAKLGMVVEK